MNRNVHITFCSLPSLGNRTEQSCQKNFLVLVKVVCQDLPQSQPLLGLFHGSHFIPFPPRCKGERSGQRIFSFGFWKKKDLHWHLATIWLVSKKDLTKSLPCVVVYEPWQVGKSTTIEFTFVMNTIESPWMMWKTGLWPKAIPSFFWKAIHVPYLTTPPLWQTACQQGLRYRMPLFTILTWLQTLCF